MDNIVGACPFYHVDEPCPYNSKCPGCKYFVKFQKRQKIFRWLLVAIGIAFVATQLYVMW